jgi:hypothetical protein
MASVGASGAPPHPEPEPEPEPGGGGRAAHDGSASTSDYVYDLGCGAGIQIRELGDVAADDDDDDGGDDDGGGGGCADEAAAAPSHPGRRRCFSEKGADDITGLSVWASAVMLGRWVRENAACLAGRHCLELGSGTGLSGLALATCDAAAGTGAGPSSVHLSDFAAATMQNLRHNLEMNDCQREPDESGAKSGQGERWRSACGCAITVSSMDWDDPHTWPQAQGASASEAGGGEGESFPRFPRVHWVAMPEALRARRVNRRRRRRRRRQWRRAAAI